MNVGYSWVHKHPNGVRSRYGRRTWHKATITNLDPELEYYYVVGDLNLGISQVQKIQFPKDRNKRTYIIFGDLGLQLADSEYRTVESMTNDINQNDISMMIHLGDIAYDMHEENGTTGDRFLRVMEPMVSKIPYQALTGNHEWYKDYSFYTHAFQSMEPNGCVTTKNGDRNEQMPNTWFYSWDSGLVHFVAISTDVFAPAPPLGFMWSAYKYRDVQYEWLRADLAKANANRENVPWIIVLGHRGMYCSGGRKMCNYETISMRRSGSILLAFFIALIAGIFYCCLTGCTLYTGVWLYKSSRTRQIDVDYEELLEDSRLKKHTTLKFIAAFLLYAFITAFSITFTNRLFIRPGLDELMNLYGVEFYLSGHEHAYERLWSIHGWKTQKKINNFDATTYIVTGAAGCREGRERLRIQQPKIVAFRTHAFGYSRMTVHNHTHLQWQQINTDVGEPETFNKIVDEVMYVKHYHGSFNRKRLRRQERQSHRRYHPLLFDPFNLLFGKVQDLSCDPEQMTPTFSF